MTGWLVLAVVCLILGVFVAAAAFSAGSESEERRR